MPQEIMGNQSQREERDYDQIDQTDPSPRSLKEAFLIMGFFKDSTSVALIARVSPRYIFMVASVTMKSGMFSFVTRRPLTPPGLAPKER